ncbi:MAG: DUF433 domain-containing protein [Gammaproteobacteria bacterium]|nr:DUF433 domain-containing protein [Gammaproteobacteria bacterium]
METKTLGRYIVADPAICHGKPTFRGTRILIVDVLKQVASGMVWEAIIEDGRYALTRDAIAEAVRASHLLPEDSDISETEWLQAAAANPALYFLKDPEEDIYTLSDGRTFYDEG